MKTLNKKLTAILTAVAITLGLGFSVFTSNTAQAQDNSLSILNQIILLLQEINASLTGSLVNDTVSVSKTKKIKIKNTKIKKKDWAQGSYNDKATREVSGEKKLTRKAISKKGLEIKWHFETIGPVAAPAAVVNNVSYVGDAAGWFYAIDDSGNEIWRTKLSGDIQSGALVTKKSVYVGTFAGTLHRLDRKTGSEIWAKTPSSDPLLQIWNGPIEVKGNLIFGLNPGDDFSAVYSVDLWSITQIHVSWVFWIKEHVKVEDIFIYLVEPNNFTRSRINSEYSIA